MFWRQYIIIVPAVITRTTKELEWMLLGFGSGWCKECKHQGSSHGGRRRAVPPGTANFRPLLGFKLDAPHGTNRTKICWICTNLIVFQASKVIVFAQCKFCMHYFAKYTHRTAREQNYFLEKCSEPVHCDPFGRTAIRAPISELTPAQT